MKHKAIIIIILCAQILTAYSQNICNPMYSMMDNLSAEWPQNNIYPSIESTSQSNELPQILVNCVCNCTTPAFVDFTSPGFAKISNASHPQYDFEAWITPFAISSNDEFQVIARISHGGCSKYHTVTISNCGSYIETIAAKTYIGIIEYRGMIPLSHMHGDHERISIMIQ